MIITRADALSTPVLPQPVQDPKVPALNDEFTGPAHTEANPGIALFVAGPTLAAMAATAAGLAALYVAGRAIVLGPEQAARDVESIKTGVQLLRDKVSVMMEKKTELKPADVEKLTKELDKLESERKAEVPPSRHASGSFVDAWLDHMDKLDARISQIKAKLGR